MIARLRPLALLLAIACSKKDAAPAAEGGAAAASPSTAAAQANEDLADVTSYRLTMEKIDRYYAAQRNVATRMQAMSPAERAAIDSADGGDDDNDDQSLDGIAAKIERVPAMAAAVRDAGLSPREFATITMAILQSGMAASVLQMRPKDNADSLVREMKANMDNVRFMREHEAELKQKQDAMAAEMKKLGVDG